MPRPTHGVTSYRSFEESQRDLLPSALATATTPVALFVGDNHLLAYLNDAGREAFGPRPLSEPAVHALPEFAELGLIDVLDDVLATGKPVTVPELPIVSYGVRSRPVRLTFCCSPVPEPDGSRGIVGVLVIGFDVTEQVLATDRLRVGERKHRYAAVTLQRSLLPHRLVQPDDVRIAACYLPGAAESLPRRRDLARDPAGLEVGGDWYDVMSLGAGRTGFVIGDVMGRGLHAAAVMGQLRAALRAYASQNLAPGEVLLHLDRHTADLDGGVMATAVYAVYDPADQTLSYARAGHLPALLRLPDGTVLDLDDAGGPPLGTGEWAWQEATVELPADSYLVMFTDGLIERRGQDIELSLAGLRRLLVNLPPLTGSWGHTVGGTVNRVALPRHGGPVDVVRDHLLTGVGLPADHADDVALLIMHAPRWTGPRAALFRSAAVDLLGGPEIAAHARAFASGVLASWHVGEELCDTGVLAVSELVANAVTHGLPPVRLRLRRTDRRLIIDVSDGDDHLPRRRLAADLDEDGRGIGIVASLAMNWGARLTPEGKAVWCEFPLRHHDQD